MVRAIGYFMKRRTIISSAIGGLSLLAGCSFVSSKDQNSPEIKIEELEVSNRHDQPHTIKISIMDGGSAVFDRQFSFAAAPHEDGYPETAKAELVDLGDWHEQASDYTLRATTESGLVEEHRLTELLDVDCTKIRVAVTRDGDLTFLVSNCQ